MIYGTTKLLINDPQKANILWQMQPNRKTRYFHTFECKNPLLLYLLYNVERRNKGKLQCTDENFMRICKILAPSLQDIKQNWILLTRILTAIAPKFLASFKLILYFPAKYSFRSRTKNIVRYLILEFA